MIERPWSYFLHFDVPAKLSLDANEVRITYDAGTDTLFSDLWPLKGPTISCWISRFAYLRIELASRLPVGTHVEDLTRAAIFRNKRLLELAAMSEELFQPTQAATLIVTPQFKLDLVHSAVVNATRAYDRRHGISLALARQRRDDKRQVLGPEEGPSYVVSTASEALAPALNEDAVVNDFASALAAIAEKHPEQQDREFERILHYWSDQPSGPIKLKTGELLIGYVRHDPMRKHPTRAISEARAAYLLKEMKAG